MEKPNIWIQSLTVIELYGLPLNHLDKVNNFNFIEAQFTLDVCCSCYKVDSHPFYRF